VRLRACERNNDACNSRDRNVAGIIAITRSAAIMFIGLISAAISRNYTKRLGHISRERKPPPDLILNSKARTDSWK